MIRLSPDPIHPPRAGTSGEKNRKREMLTGKMAADYPGWAVQRLSHPAHVRAESAQSVT
jgi:hypothetical protein